MTDWIDLDALWRIVVAGLIFGAGLPALFGIGLRAASVSRPVQPNARTAGEVPATATPPAARVAAVLCFAVVLAAVGWGIYLIVAGE